MVDVAPSPQVTLEVRGLVHAGDLASATNCVLAATLAEPKLDLKLRTFAPIFGAVCDTDDAATACQLQVWAAPHTSARECPVLIPAQRRVSVRRSRWPQWV